MCQHCSCLVHFHHRNMLTISSVWSVWSTPSHNPNRLGGGERSCLLLQSHISVWSAPSHSLTISTPQPDPLGGEEGGDSAGSASRRQAAHFAPLCSVTKNWKLFFIVIFTAEKDYIVNELIFLSKPNRFICPLSLYFLVKVFICRFRLFFSSQEESLTIPLRNKKRFDLWSER